MFSRLTTNHQPAYWIPWLPVVYYSPSLLLWLAVIPNFRIWKLIIWTIGLSSQIGCCYRWTTIMGDSPDAIIHAPTITWQVDGNNQGGHRFYSVSIIWEHVYCLKFHLWMMNHWTCTTHAGTNQSTNVPMVGWPMFFWLIPIRLSGKTNQPPTSQSSAFFRMSRRACNFWHRSFEGRLWWTWGFSSGLDDVGSLT